MAELRILFVGDIVGKTGRRAVQAVLPGLVDRHRPHVVIGNCENLAHGFGITRDTLDEMGAAGIQWFTSGNHIFDKKEAGELLEERPYVLRPLNYPPGVPGNGKATVPLPDGRSLTIVNLMGRAFMAPVDCPFRAMDRVLASEHDLVFVDFHAEATAEKAAFAHAFDGKVTAIVGTHTHVQTADDRVLPGGTAFVTDVGMTGAMHSVIGVEPEAAIRRMRTTVNERLTPAAGPWWFAGVRLTVLNDRVTEFERILIRSGEE